MNQSNKKILRRRDDAEFLKESIGVSADDCFYMNENDDPSLIESMVVEIKKKYPKISLGLDSIGGGKITNAMMECLSPGGKIIIYGALAKDPTFKVQANLLILKSISITGFTLLEVCQIKSFVAL